MTPTVEEVIELAQALLADQAGQEFDGDNLMPYFKSAYEDLAEALELLSAQESEKTAVLAPAIPAGTATIDPSSYGVTDVGSIYFVEERPAGGSDGDWVKVDIVTELAPGDPTTNFGECEIEGGKIATRGATADIEVRIRYQSRGSIPTTGTVGVQGSLNFLANMVAAKALLGREESLQVSTALRQEASGYLERLRQRAVKQQQAGVIVRPPFRSNIRFRG